MVEITQLRYFMEVAASQHLTISANKLHIAQPALSMTIHRLEENLGVRLFEKKGRNIALTETGRFLYEELKPVMEKLDELPEQVRAYAANENKTIQINVLAASRIVSDAIIDYKRKKPDAVFKLIQNENEEDCDIEITTRLFYHHPSEDETVFIQHEPIYIAVPAAGRFEGRSTVTMAEIEQENLISLSGSRQFRQICNKFCDIAGIHPRLSFESDSPATVQNMIIAGLGIGFWPAKSWGVHDDRRIRLLTVEDISCGRDIIISLKSRRDKAAAYDFFCFLKAYLGRIEQDE